jgi:LysM domain.
MRLLRGVSSLVALALGLFAAPAALLWWGRYPQLSLAGLLGPDDGSLLLGLVTATGWLAWAVFALATALEAVRLLVGRPVWTLPGLSVIQQLSAGLLLAVLALAATTAAPRPPVAAGVVHASPTPLPADSAVALPQGEPARSGYQVRPGDDLWSISAAILGDGRRWRELAAANPALLADPIRELTAGTLLALPEGSTWSAAPMTPGVAFIEEDPVGAEPGRAEDSPTMHKTSPHQDLRVRVERGDTLSGLALEHLGGASRWPRIAAANRSLITDPDHIEIGWRLVIPGVESSPGQPAQTPAHPQAGRPVEGPTPAHRLDPPTPRTADAGPSDDAAAPETSAAPPTVAVVPEPAVTAAAPAADPSAESPAPEAVEPAADESPFGRIGPLGTVAAAVIIGAVEARRALRLRERPRGRRLIDTDPAAARLRVALGTVQRPDRIVALDRALRHVGEQCAASGTPLPQLSRIELDDHELRLIWAAPAGPPPSGFTGAADRWRLAIADAAALQASEHPCPYPCVVSVGTAEDGCTVLVNVEQSRVLGVAADDSELTGSALLAMGIELACAPWSSEVRVLAAGAGSELLALAGGDRVQRAPDLRAAISEATALASERRKALTGTPLAELRADPDRADAVAPLILVLGEEPSPIELARLERSLAGEPCGVVALLPTSSGAAATWQVHRRADALAGRLDGLGVGLTPHTVPAAIAGDLAGLLADAESSATEPAWWAGGDPTNVRPLPKRAEEAVDIVRVSTDPQPRLLLIGPTELTGTRGGEPTRARQQLIELCAWILEHPRSTATQMAAGLGIAEGTRRSNLSRLRGWLGVAADGQAYLPEAYAGRIELHPSVSSDWQELQTLLAVGLDRLPESSLVAVLELVRGAPLADAAPGQWHWAEELRTDISSAVRDAGLVLVERALARRDIELARWAAARALTVAPADELLMAARIRTEHLAGATTDVHRLVTQVTRQARQLGVDLLPETVELCQQVIEGAARARRA